MGGCFPSSPCVREKTRLLESRSSIPILESKTERLLYWGLAEKDLVSTPLVRPMHIYQQWKLLSPACTAQRTVKSSRSELLPYL